VRQVAIEGTIVHPERSDPLAIGVRVQIADVLDILHPVNVRSVAVEGRSEVAEHVIEGAVLHNHNDDCVDVLLELLRSH